MKFLMFWIAVLSATLSHAQELTLQLSNVSLKDFFTAVKRQTGYGVFASDETLDSVTSLSISVTNKPLRDVLNEVLAPRMLSYQIASKTILVYPAAVPVEQQNSMPIEGYVLAADGSPVPGTTIAVKRTGSHTVADNTGHFRVNARPGDMVQFSSVGYHSREVTIGSSQKINIVMDQRLSTLDETTVVAYGTMTKREITGSVETVKARTLSAVSSANVLDRLQGRLAGADITHVSASPGSGGILMTIRGYNSLDVEEGRRFSNPLWVVDDVPMSTNTSAISGTSFLADLDPDIIESVQVLKDASAASLYGSRASNGVVIVRTNRGKFNQRPQVFINLSSSYNIISRLPTITIGSAERRLRMQAFLNYPYAYVDEQERAYRYPRNYDDVYHHPNGRIDYFFRRYATMDNGFYFQDSLNSFFNNATNFFPYFFEHGKQLNANIQAYGGTANMFYGLGAGFYNEEGVVTGSGFKRANLHSHLHVQATDAFALEMRFYAAATDRARADRSATFGMESPIIESVPADPFLLSSLLPPSEAVLNSFKKKISGTNEENRSIRLRATIKGSYRLLPGLNISSSAAVDYSSQRRNNFFSSMASADNTPRTIGESGMNTMALNENLLTWEKSLARHRIKSLVGFAYQFDRVEYNGGQALNSPSDRIYYARPGFPMVGERTVIGQNGQLITEILPYQRFLSNKSEKALLSFFSRIDYQLDQKYFLTLSARRDGSSVFGENTRWGMFPSIAAAWILPTEKLFHHAKWLSLVKLRASWGLSGMHFSQDYLALGIMQTGQYSYQGGGVLFPDFNTGLYNESLTWEETKQANLGLDVELFNNRFTITAEFFRRFTDNMLVPVKLPGTYNGYLLQWRNVAAVSNSGFDLSLGYHIIRQKELSWKASLNISGVRNRFEKSYINDNANSLFSSRLVTGKPLNGIFGWRTNGFVTADDQLPVFVNPRGISNPLARDPSVFYKQGDFLFIDKNSDGIISEHDQEYLGSALPVFSGGFFTSFSWKRLELSMLWTGQFGRHIINALPLNSLRTDDLQYISHPLLFDAPSTIFWQQGKNNAQFPPIQYDSGSGIYDYFIDRHVERVNWTRLKLLQARYTLPVKFNRKFGINEIQFVTGIENLLLISNYSGTDPETVSITDGIDYGRHYPLPRKFNIGFTIKM